MNNVTWLFRTIVAYRLTNSLGLYAKIICLIFEEDLNFFALLKLYLFLVDRDRDSEKEKE
jgi:hypothetical protein